MSIATASRFAVEIETGEARSAATGGSTAEKASAAIQQLTAYFPAEALGIYIALIGLLEASSSGLKWALFGIGVAAVVFFVWVTYQPQNRTTERKTRNFLWLNIFGIVSFTAYAAALPGTPFLDLTDQAMRFGAAAAVILAPVIPALAKKLGLRIPGQR